MVSTCARRAQVLHAIKRGVSQRRACVLLSVSRSVLGYVSRLDEPDQPHSSASCGNWLRSNLDTDTDVSASFFVVPDIA